MCLSLRWSHPPRSSCLGHSSRRISVFSVNFYSPKINTPALRNKPMALPNTFLGWRWPIITYPEPKIIQTSGLDAAMYLRVLKFGETNHEPTT